MPKRSSDLPQDRSDLVGFEDHYEAGYIDPVHTHDWAQMAFALSGVMTVNTDVASFILPPNRAIWIPAHTPHETICRSEMVFQIMYASPDLPGSPQECRVFEVSLLVRALIREVVDFGYQYEMAGRQESIVRLLLSEINRMPTAPVQLELPTDTRLRRVCEALLKNPADPRDIDEWAKDAGMARRTFTRIFRDETGMGLATWRRQVRVMEAASRIAAGEPISTVAYDVGYDSPSAFTAMFRRTLGMTPSVFCHTTA